MSPRHSGLETALLTNTSLVGSGVHLMVSLRFNNNIPSKIVAYHMQSLRLLRGNYSKVINRGLGSVGFSRGGYRGGPIRRKGESLIGTPLFLC